MVPGLLEGSAEGKFEWNDLTLSSVFLSLSFIHIRRSTLISLHPSLHPPTHPISLLYCTHTSVSRCDSSSKNRMQDEVILNAWHLPSYMVLGDVRQSSFYHHWSCRYLLKGHYNQMETVRRENHNGSNMDKERILWGGCVIKFYSHLFLTLPLLNNVWLKCNVIKIKWNNYFHSPQEEIKSTWKREIF